jgi:hypothetical protein
VWQRECTSICAEQPNPYNCQPGIVGLVSLCIPNDQRQAVTVQWDEIVAIAAGRPNLTAAGAIVQEISSRARHLHKALLHIAGQYPVLADVDYHFVGCYFPALHWYAGSGAPESTSGGDFWLTRYF